MAAAAEPEAPGAEAVDVVAEAVDVVAEAVDVAAAAAAAAAGAVDAALAEEDPVGESNAFRVVAVAVAVARQGLRLPLRRILEARMIFLNSDLRNKVGGRVFLQLF